MGLKEAVSFGLAGEKLARTITGTSEVSPARSAMVVGFIASLLD